MEPEEELRRAQELLRVLQRRGTALDAGDVARGSGLAEAAVRAAARGAAPNARTTLPPDGSVPLAATVRELACYPVPASELVRAELRTDAEQVWVHESVVERDGAVLQFRSGTSVARTPPDPARLVRPVDVEAVRADEDTAAALGASPGTVVLLQVVLTEGADGARLLQFAYSRADAVRVLHP